MADYSDDGDDDDDERPASISINRPASTSRPPLDFGLGDVGMHSPWAGSPTKSHCASGTLLFSEVANEISPVPKRPPPAVSPGALDRSIARELGRVLNGLFKLLPHCADWLRATNEDQGILEASRRGRSNGAFDVINEDFVKWAQIEARCLHFSWDVSAEPSHLWLLAADAEINPPEPHVSHRAQVNPPEQHGARLRYVMTLVGTRMRTMLHALKPEFAKLRRAASTHQELGVYFRAACLLLNELYHSNVFGSTPAPPWAPLFDGLAAVTSAEKSTEHLQQLREMRARIKELSDDVIERATARGGGDEPEQQPMGDLNWMEAKKSADKKRRSKQTPSALRAYARNAPPANALAALMGRSPKPVRASARAPASELPPWPPTTEQQQQHPSPQGRHALAGAPSVEQHRSGSPTVRRTSLVGHMVPPSTPEEATRRAAKPEEGTWNALMSAFDGSLKRLDDVTKRTKMLTSVSAPVLPTKISSSVKFTSIEPESSKPAESPEAFRLPRLANARWNDPRLDGTSVGEATRFAEELSKGPAAHSPQKAPRQRRLEASGALALIKRASLPADFDDEVASIASSMALSPLTSPTLEGRGRIYPRVPRKKASRPYKPPYMTASKSPPQDESLQEPLEPGTPTSPSFPKEPSPLKTAQPSTTRRPTGEDRLNELEVYKMLEQLPWLTGLTGRQMGFLTQVVTGNQFLLPKFGVVYPEGVVGDRLFILVKGSVRLTGTDPKHSREVTVGGSFGEAQLVLPGPRAATAVALTDAHLLFIDHSDLLEGQTDAAASRDGNSGSPPPVAAPAKRGRKDSGEIQTSSVVASEPLTTEQMQILLGTLIHRLMKAKLFVPNDDDKSHEHTSWQSGWQSRYQRIHRRVENFASLDNFASARGRAFDQEDLNQLRALVEKAGQPLPISQLRFGMESSNPTSREPSTKPARAGGGAIGAGTLDLSANGFVAGDSSSHGGSTAPFSRRASMSDSSVNPWLSESSDNGQSGGPRIKSERMIGSIPEEPGAEAKDPNAWMAMLPPGARAAMEQFRS